MFPIKTFGRNIKKALLEPGYALNAFVKRTQASASYRFSKNGRAPFPESITFFLTYKCNLRCKMCGQWSETGYVKNKIVDANPQLKVNVWKRLVDEISGHKIRFILLIMQWNNYNCLK